MRSLLTSPAGELSDGDLAALYEFPLGTGSGGAWVRAVFIGTADGAAQGGEQGSASLSGPGDRRVFGLQRSLCDVVLVGAGTARAESYRPVLPAEVDAGLRARFGLAPLPAIAVVSRSLTIDEALLGGSAPTLVITTLDAPEAALASVRRQAPVVQAGTGGVDVAAAIDALAAMGHRRILCEGGPSLMAQVVAAGRLDDLCLTFAPLLVGGERKRILQGPDVVPTRRLRLAHLLEDDGEIFARYLTDRSS